MSKIMEFIKLLYKDVNTVCSPKGGDFLCVHWGVHMCSSSDVGCIEAVVDALYHSVSAYMATSCISANVIIIVAVNISSYGVVLFINCILC